MGRRKGQAVSRDTRDTRAKGKAHGDTVSPRAKQIVMVILHAFGCRLCPLEIFDIATYFGLIKDDMHCNTINVACTALSKRGAIISTSGPHGKGAGKLDSVRYVLSWVQRVEGPHNYVGRVKGGGPAILFPCKLKSKVKAAYKNPKLWTRELRAHAWVHAFERFMVSEMDGEAV